MEKDFFKNLTDQTYDPVVQIEKSRRERHMFYLVRELEASPDKLENIEKMMQYRDHRTKQSWLSGFYYRSRGYRDGDLKMQSLSLEIGRLDRERRNYHNQALASFYSFVNDMKSNGIPPIYSGRIMTPFDDKEKRYGDPNIRQEMTDAFLKMLYDVSETTIADLGIERGEYSEGVKAFNQIKGELRHQDHSYKVDKPLIKDDGDITFNDM